MTDGGLQATLRAPLGWEFSGMTVEKEIMNIFDAAALLGVHVQTLRKLARQKKIPSFKVGRDWKFRKEALVRWADEQQGADTGADACSVLVIDDEEQTGMAMAGMAERFGCRARQTTTGADGLRMVAEAAPDVILLDLVLLEMNGPQFLTELRKTHPLLPVVLVTGHPKSDLIKQAMLHAPILLLPKPAEAELLERTVRTLVGQKLAPLSKEQGR